MNYSNCYVSPRHRATTGLPGLINMFLDDLPTAQNKVNGKVNISETDTSFDIELALPSFDKSDFKVHVDGKYLSISAEKAVENSTDSNDAEKQTNRRYIRREFSFSTSFKRTFTLPEQADVNAINAQYNNGILVVSIGKKATVAPTVQQIEIA